MSMLLRLAVIAVLVGGLAVWFVHNLGRKLNYRNAPVEFWLALAGQIAGLIGCLYVAIRLLARLSQ